MEGRDENKFPALFIAFKWVTFMLLCAFTLESRGNFKALSPFLYFYSFPTVWSWTYLTEVWYNPKEKEVIDEEFCEIYSLRNSYKNVMMLNDKELGDEIVLKQMEGTFELKGESE